MFPRCRVQPPLKRPGPLGTVAMLLLPGVGTAHLSLYFPCNQHGVSPKVRIIKRSDEPVKSELKFPSCIPGVKKDSPSHLRNPVAFFVSRQPRSRCCYTFESGCSSNRL